MDFDQPLAVAKPLLTLADLPGAARDDAGPQAGDDESEALHGRSDGMEALASNDEWAFRKADRMVDKLPDLRGDLDRKTEGEVFDRQTLLILHKLLTHGVLRSLDFPVSTGKEANVFRGTTPGGGYVAVKIFRVNTSTFKHVLKYIQGDERFDGISGDKRGLVLAWTQKEFRNLIRLAEVGIPVPEPLKAIGNVLVTEYVGIAEGAWPTLKAVGDLDDAQAIWEQVSRDYVKAYNEADLIHADFSEYNIMLEGAGGPVDKQRARFIDVGQAVLKNHPMAQEFLDRDLKNITAYFRRQGVRVQPQDIKMLLKHERTTKNRTAKEKAHGLGVDGHGDAEQDEDGGDEE